MENKEMVDACVFLAAILDEPLTSKCNEYFKEIPERKICITPIIIEEVIRKLREDVKKDDMTSKSTLTHKGKKIERDTLQAHLQVFFKLITSAELLLPRGNYQKYFEECKSLRLGDGINDMDQTNISLTIDNNCAEFVTTDKNIWEDSKKIKRINDSNINIRLIK